VAEKKQHPKQSSRTETGKDDLRASLKVIGWLNGTLDAVAKSVGRQASRDAALALMILHRSHKAKSGKKAVNGKKFLQSFRAWRSSPNSQMIEESWGVALAQLILGNLVTVRIQLTGNGIDRIEEMRETINRRLKTVRRDLSNHERQIFNTLIEESLPLPPPKLPRQARRTKR
jgi:hypothetical protein